MTVVIYTFRLEVNVEDRLRNPSLLTIKFNDVRDLRLTNFNHQNAINGIKFDNHWSGPLQREVTRVRFLQGFGLSCEFECDSIEVLTLEPFVKR